MNIKNDIRNIYNQRLNNIIDETKKLIDQNGINKKIIQQQRDKFFDVTEKIAKQALFETVDFMELIGLFDMKILNYIINRI